MELKNFRIKRCLFSSVKMFVQINRSFEKAIDLDAAIREMKGAIAHIKKVHSPFIVNCDLMQESILQECMASAYLELNEDELNMDIMLVAHQHGNPYAENFMPSFTTKHEEGETELLQNEAEELIHEFEHEALLKLKKYGLMVGNKHMKYFCAGPGQLKKDSCYFVSSEAYDKLQLICDITNNPNDINVKGTIVTKEQQVKALLFTNSKQF